VEDSLKRLGTDHLDLYQAHCYDYTTRLDETLAAFHDMVAGGKLAFTAWSPLAGGWLSGKYCRGEAPPQDSRVGRKDRWDDQPEQRESDTTWKVVEALRQVSGRLGKSPAQVALNWLLQKGEGIVPIIGARTAEQLKDNLGASGWRLGSEDMRLLDAASDQPLPYPYRFLQSYAKRG
jgi:aryl-alcohol dehydrogenase-like predicted oxidoreductase